MPIGLASFNGSRIQPRGSSNPTQGKLTPVVYLLPDAPHYFYISDQAFVVRVTREFLLGKVRQ